MDKKFKNDWMNQYSTRKRQPMKKIQHPSLGQLSIILAPWAVCMVIGLILGKPAQWINWLGMASVGIMIMAVTYFCVKQKCYIQLVRALVALVIMAFVCFGSELIFADYYGG